MRLFAVHESVVDAVDGCAGRPEQRAFCFITAVLVVGDLIAVAIIVALYHP